jgi:hypothetical protein
MGKEKSLDKPRTQERRKSERRNVAYYLPVINNDTQQVIGHLVDMSTTGLMIDAKNPIPSGVDYNMRLDLTEDIWHKPIVRFVARSKWSRPDSIQPYLHNAGFEIIKISPADAEAIKLIAEKYGEK